MTTKKTRTRSLEHECYALVLQGGGALGAYQAGVFEELAATPYLPHWVAGVSIGAINAALIAGNPPERRIARLREFWLWHLVSSGMSVPPPPWEEPRAAFNHFSAAVAALIATSGHPRTTSFRAPRYWNIGRREHATCARPTSIPTGWLTRASMPG